jgi:UDP-N-acetylglucosamine 1-carboxyvinyltransferase
MAAKRTTHALRTIFLHGAKMRSLIARQRRLGGVAKPASGDERTPQFPAPGSPAPPILIGREVTRVTSGAQDEVLRIAGGRRLTGAVSLHGAKNAALPCLAATLLIAGESILERVPTLADVDTMIDLLRHVGATVRRHGDRVSVTASTVRGSPAAHDIARRMRASVLVVGPLLTREGVADVALPGGCAIGERPIDMHLEGFQQLGAEVRESLAGTGVSLRAPHGLRGTRVRLPWPSVGATENLMMAAALARGETVIEKAAEEPEILDLGRFLVGAGAHIGGLGTPVIHIEGVPALHAPPPFPIRSDRIEAATYLLAAAVTRGRITVQPIGARDVGTFLTVCRQAGAGVRVERDQITLEADDRPWPVAMTTEPFPGFPTDLQAPMMAWLATATGNSRITETVFQSRFGHVAPLNHMGARVRVDGATAFLYGVPQLHGTLVEAGDLRAAAALVLAGLNAEGETWVRGLRHLDRGYSDLEQQLVTLGAQVERLAASAIPSQIWQLGV